MKGIVRLLLPMMIVSVVLVSCVKSGGNGDTGREEDTVSVSTVEYSEGFDIRVADDYKQITVYNPWVKGAVQQRFYLVRDLSVKTPGDGLKMKIPVESVAISSCTHTEFLDMIGCIERVNAMCSPELVYNEKLRKRYAEGKIRSIGDAFNVDLEGLLVSNPDVYMVASYNNQNDNTDRLLKSGVNVVYNNEWTETTLLGRAEWLKFVAAFFDKSEMADSLFREIEQNYREAVEIASGVTNRPTVMAGGNFKGTWYMPGGRSWMGRLFADAGGEYYYSEDSTTTSLPLNFESVLNNFHDADVWVNAPTTTLYELNEMDKRHGLFEPMRTGRVYSFYAKVKEGGANDFWESAVAHPDRIVRDMIWALHPQIQTDYEPYYIMILK